MTVRRLVLAGVLGAAALGIVAPAASATGPSVETGGGKAACAWVKDEGVCISNPFEDLPPVSVPKLPKLP